MRISDWSSDVCSSDLEIAADDPGGGLEHRIDEARHVEPVGPVPIGIGQDQCSHRLRRPQHRRLGRLDQPLKLPVDAVAVITIGISIAASSARSEEHTSELQSLMRISYAVFCLQKKITS